MSLYDPGRRAAQRIAGQYGLHHIESTSRATMRRSRKKPLVDTDDEGNRGPDRRFGVDRGDLEEVSCIRPW